jgi:hypothetical protein
VDVAVVAIAVVGGLAGGALAAVAVAAVQTWMARPRGPRIETAVPAPGHPPQRAASGGFDRFTNGGKRVLALAQDEAIRLNHNYIGTEHLVLGIMREGEGVAARALAEIGVPLDRVRAAVESIVGRGDAPTSPSEITLSPRSKKVIELAIDEARRRRTGQIDTEHLLLGLVREGEGIGWGILESLGVTAQRIREAIDRRPPN